MTLIVKVISWLLIIAALGGAAAFYVLAQDIQLTRECDARSIESLQQQAKEWIVTRLTKSRHPYSNTAIPDGTKPSEIESYGFYGEEQRMGIVLYTEASGGVIYLVIFGHDCSAEYIAKRCPNRNCPLAREAWGTPSNPK